MANAKTLFQNARWFNKPMVWPTKSNPLSPWIAGRSAFTSTKLTWLTKELPDVTRIEKVLAGMDDTGAATLKEINAIKTAYLAAGYAVFAVIFGLYALPDDTRSAVRWVQAVAPCLVLAGLACTLPLSLVVGGAFLTWTVIQTRKRRRT